MTPDQTESQRSSATAQHIHVPLARPRDPARRRTNLSGHRLDSLLHPTCPSTSVLGSSSFASRILDPHDRSAVRADLIPVTPGWDLSLSSLSARLKFAGVSVSF